MRNLTLLDQRGPRNNVVNIRPSGLDCFYDFKLGSSHIVNYSLE
jgi:hypothetical protein